MSKTTHADCDHPNTKSARQTCRMQDAEYRQRKNGYTREYRAHSEVRERLRERRARPDARERKRHYDREYYARPDIKQRKREYDARPDVYAKKQATNIKRRRAMADTAVEPLDNERIYDRDGWVCHLCHEDVDPLTFWPHPESASLDHITPLSEGGTHTEDNVACSHLRCNLSKGNRYEVAL